MNSNGTSNYYEYRKIEIVLTHFALKPLLEDFFLLFILRLLIVLALPVLWGIGFKPHRIRDLRWFLYFCLQYVRNSDKYFKDEQKIHKNH